MLATMADPAPSPGAAATLHFATYFDSRYLAQGLALHQSLETHSPGFVLWVLCLDDETHRVLGKLGLANVRLVKLEDLESADPELLGVKAGRLTYEYYWTCGPAFLRYLLELDSSIGILAYVDADIFFFADTAVLLDELGEGDILLHEHHEVVEPDDKLTTRCRFNVGVVLFRRTPDAIACIQRWREQCIEWCFDRYENGRFGDQAYLDDWPASFKGVVVAQHEGIGMAPWRVGGVQLERTGNVVRVEGWPLVFFHFSKMRRLTRFLYQLHDWRFHRYPMDRVLRHDIYAPYARALYSAERRIRQAGRRLQLSRLKISPQLAAARKKRARAGQLPLLRRWQRFMFVMGRFTL